MKAEMKIREDSSWELTLEAQTATETAMLLAVARGYGVKVECGGAGTPENPMLIVSGEKARA